MTMELKLSHIDQHWQFSCSSQVKNDRRFYLLLLLGTFSNQSPRLVFFEPKASLQDASFTADRTPNQSRPHEPFTWCKTPAGFTEYFWTGFRFTEAGRVLSGVILAMSALSVNATAQSTLRMVCCSTNVSSLTIVDSRILKWRVSS